MFAITVFFVLVFFIPWAWFHFGAQNFDDHDDGESWP